MENKKWIGISIVSLIIALSAIGYNITNQTYFCESRGIVMECARFSASELRCYPSLINRIGYRDCSNGWVKVETIIEPNITLGILPLSNPNIKKWICNTNECLPYIK